jgi:adenylate cyclase
MTEKREKILVVDDERLNINMLINLLGTDYDTVIAKNGKQALKRAFADIPPDLILLDVMMPEMDGYEVCRRIRADSRTQHIPIIFVSAMSDTMDEAKGFELGAVDYITKPISPLIVLARVKSHLKICKLKNQLQVQNQQLQEQADELEKRNGLIAKEKEKSDKLLLNILPVRVANDLRETGKTEPEAFDNVTVFFSDIVGFTKISAQLETQMLINELNSIFTAFDNIIEQHQCERVKTIGDAYLAVCGMPEINPNHAENIINSAIDIVDYLTERNQTVNIQWKVRIGINTGKVIGGIVGVKKYLYDVFGDTVNTASRMESNSEPMKINISETTYQMVKNKYKVIARDSLSVKGKGNMNMYFIDN